MARPCPTRGLIFSIARPIAPLWCVGFGLIFHAPIRAGWKALGPYGGPAAVVQVDPHALRTVIAGTSNALLFRSRDLGETWDSLPFPLQLRAVLHTLVIDPLVPNIYLAGVSPENSGFSGLLRSADAGSTWQPVPAFRGVQVRAVAIFRGNSQIIAAGTDLGAFLSEDGGFTWRRISHAENRELQPVVSLAFDPVDRRTIYVGTPHLPWKTTDGGLTWQSIHSGMIDDSDVFSIAVDRNNGRRVFAGACSGLYRSLNGALKWTRLAGATAASYRTYTIVQEPLHENVLFAGTTNGTIRSLDGGASWERIGPYPTHSIGFDLRHPGRIFIATERAGLLRSEDGGTTWQQVNRGFCNRHLTALAVGDRGALYAGTINDSVEKELFRLAHGADEWTRLASNPRLFVEPLRTVWPSSSEGGLVQSEARSVTISRDSGRTWTRVFAPASEPLSIALSAAPWDSKPIASGGEGGVFLSRDPDGAWQRLRFPDNLYIRAVAALDPPWIAALGASDVVFSMDGETWQAGRRLPGGMEIHGIVRLSGEGLLAATSAGFWMSPDSGRSWHSLGGALDGNTIQAICDDPARPSVFFAAHYGVIYKSSDRGRSWIRISPGSWPVSSVKQLVVMPGSPERLFVLTHQQGVFALALDESETDGPPRTPNGGGDTPITVQWP